MDPYLTVKQLEDLEARTWASRGETRVSAKEGHALIKEVMRLRGLNAMLTDTVVMAAALHFEQIKSASEEGYASEVLHETAAQLVKENPRLAGSFKAEV